MKRLKIGVLILMVIFFGVDISHAQTAEESYDKGVEYAIQREFKKAKEEFEKALKIDQSFLPAELSLEVIKDAIEQKIKTETAIHLFKGTSYYNKGQPDLAGREFTKAIEMDPKYPVSYYSRGSDYDNKGLYDQAISDYTKAIELDSQYAEAYNNRGSVHLKKGLYDQAIGDFDKAIAINPNSAPSYSNRAIAYLQKGQHNQARSDFAKALEIDPKFTDAYDNRGYLYFVFLEDKVNGCADWKKACELGKCDNYNLAKQKGECSSQ